MSYPINYPTPQNANVQIFRGGDSSTTAHIATRDWVKPQGASFVWFTLIGAGGGGGGGMLYTGASINYYGGGGASGNVTNFMCPAFLIPDVLQISVGKGGDGGISGIDAAATNGGTPNDTKIVYQQKNGVGYTLLTATGGGGGTGANLANGFGGTAAGSDPITPITATGFYNSINGQNGQNGANSATTNGLTFLMGGSGMYQNNGTTVGYYGYISNLNTGYSQISPIIMSIAGGPPMFDAQKGISGSFGCGGNGGGYFGTLNTSNGGRGGDGLAIIVTW